MRVEDERLAEIEARLRAGRGAATRDEVLASIADLREARALLAKTRTNLDRLVEHMATEWKGRNGPALGEFVEWAGAILADLEDPSPPTYAARATAAGLTRETVGGVEAGPPVVVPGEEGK